VPAAFAVAFDGAGALYVGTNDGLARFDGRAFIPVPLPVPGAVWRLAEAPDGSVWGLTNRAGLFRLAPGGLPEAVPPPSPLRARLHEQVWPIRLVLDRRSRPWLSGGDGTVYAWEGGAPEPWRPVLIPETDFLADFFPRGEGEAEHLVVAGRDRVGVLSLGGGPMTWLPPLEGRVRFVRPHPEAIAWVGADDGVYRLDPEGTLRPVSQPGEGVWQHTAPGVDREGRLLAFTNAPLGMRIVPLRARRGGDVWGGARGGAPRGPSPPPRARPRGGGLDRARGRALRRRARGRPDLPPPPGRRRRRARQRPRGQPGAGDSLGEHLRRPLPARRRPAPPRQRAGYPDGPRPGDRTGWGGGLAHR
jgi:hypothetical protein